MNRVLRVVRITAIMGCCALAGLYAGRWFFADQAPSAPRATANAEAPLADQLPTFSLVDLDSRRRDIGEWVGRPMLINFWATWCAPCRKEMPLLQTLHDDSPGGLRVIGVAVDSQPAVESFIAEAGVTYPILVGQEDAIAAAESFGPEFIALPFSVLVAADGAVIGLESGELDPAELQGLASLATELAAGRLTVAQAREHFPGS
jgi:thiol-disulfide isomerase/thioredoxin